MTERYEVNDEASFQTALIEVRTNLAQTGFNEIQAAKFLTAVSELARNILKYAERGWLEVTPIHHLNRSGLQVDAIDFGQGIDDIEKAMSEHYSSSGTLGQGLPGAKRLVDEFDINTSPQGTTVRVRSWV
ncbi:anti-sigma regulatory factor [Vibrio maerlii]|uniref:anti-sigma regulatory factor n=1 Tax=Vibrio maerlii TaxID=2231648 RepID=UPI000E3C4281|nr:anti-sigma regulatory factor [Vibrio maerlii]